MFFSNFYSSALCVCVKAIFTFKSLKENADQNERSKMPKSVDKWHGEAKLEDFIGKIGRIFY